MKLVLCIEKDEEKVSLGRHFINQFMIDNIRFEHADLLKVPINQLGGVRLAYVYINVGFMGGMGSDIDAYIWRMMRECPSLECLVLFSPAFTHASLEDTNWYLAKSLFVEMYGSHEKEMSRWANRYRCRAELAPACLTHT